MEGTAVAEGDGCGNGVGVCTALVSAVAATVRVATAVTISAAGSVTAVQPTNNHHKTRVANCRFILVSQTSICRKVNGQSLYADEVLRP